MTKNSRWLLALISALVAMTVTAAWTFIAEDAFVRRVLSRLVRHVAISQAGGPRPDPYDPSAHVFYWIIMASLFLAVGGVVAMLVLLPLSKFRSRAAIYILILAIVLPFSLYNYDQRDDVLGANAQVWLNLILIFLSATVALWLNSFKVMDSDARVAKSLSVSLLVFGGALTPAFFTFVWFLVAVKIITMDQSKHITWTDITSTAGVASAAIAWLTYRKGKQEKSQIKGHAAG